MSLSGKPWGSSNERNKWNLLTVTEDGFDELLAEIEERWKRREGEGRGEGGEARSDLGKTTIRTSVFSPITPMLAPILDIRGAP